MYIKKLLIIGVAVISCGMSCFSEMRFWHDKSGNEFEGEFSKEVFGNTYLRGRNGKVFPVPTAELTESDVEYIRCLIPPKVSLRVTKKVFENTNFPPEYDTGVWDDHEMTIIGTMEVSKVSKDPYYGTLKGELYLIGEERATDDFRLFGKKAFAIDFPDERGAKVTKTLTSPLRYFDMRGEEVRGAVYKGYVAVVMSEAGDILAFKSSLTWFKEDKLPLLRKFWVPTWFDKEVKKKSVPRPTWERDLGPHTR